MSSITSSIELSRILTNSLQLKDNDIGDFNAYKTINEYFGIITSFDILICRGSWEMEVQVISRKRSKFSATYDDTKSIGITDYRLEEIVIRYDIARFGHYL